MTKIKTLFVATTLMAQTLAGCAWDEQIRNMTPEQRAVLIQGLSGIQANMNHQYDLQAQQNANWYNTEVNGIVGAGMIGRSNPVYVCSYYGCP